MKPDILALSIGTTRQSNYKLRDLMEDNPQGSDHVTFDLAEGLNSFTDAPTRAY